MTLIKLLENKMNNQIVKGNLNELKGSIKQTWSKLTDDDMTYLDGGVDKIVGRIQNAYGFTKERASEEFENFKKSNSNYFRDNRDANMEEFMGSATPLNGNNIDTNKIKRQASNMLDSEVMDPAAEYLKKARDIAGQAATRSTELVKQYPGYTVLGAAAIGFLTAAYIFRRK